MYSAAAVTIIFYLLDSAKDLVLGIPFSIYSTFVIEQKHGFNKQTLGLFVMDVIKSVGVSPACPSKMHLSPPPPSPHLPSTVVAPLNVCSCLPSLLPHASALILQFLCMETC